MLLNRWLINKEIAEHSSRLKDRAEGQTYRDQEPEDRYVQRNHQVLPVWIWARWALQAMEARLRKHVNYLKTNINGRHRQLGTHLVDKLQQTMIDQAISRENLWKTSLTAECHRPNTQVGIMHIKLTIQAEPCFQEHNNRRLAKLELIRPFWQTLKNKCKLW